jgi:hypothetical protein
MRAVMEVQATAGLPEGCPDPYRQKLIPLETRRPWRERRSYRHPVVWG